MRFGRARATVHVVEGSPWKEAIISMLEPRSPYRPWRTGDSDPIEDGDKVIAVFDTDPVSVLAAVGVVGPDRDVQAAFAAISSGSRPGLLEYSTLNMTTPSRLLPMAGGAAESDADVLEAYMRQGIDACFGRSTLAQARTLLASGGWCTGCDSELDLTGPDAAEHVHLHPADPGPLGQEDDTDWPAVVCDSCQVKLRAGGFASFVDFRYSLAPACPACAARRTMKPSFGRPRVPVRTPPWEASMGCVRRSVDWVCGECSHQWGLDPDLDYERPDH